MNFSQKIVLITGYYGFGNAGDEAILEVMLSQLRSLRPGLRAIVTSGNPAETSLAHGVEAIDWRNVLAIQEAVQRCDLAVIGGGGLYHDYWGLNPQLFLTEGHWGIPYYTGSAVLAALHRKPLMLCAVGVGPLLSEQGQRLTRISCQAANAITVRDPGSRELLQSIGIPKESVCLTADPAFGLSADTEVCETTPRGRPLLAVAARYWDIGVCPDFWERELAGALDLFLDREGGEVLFVPFQRLAGRQEDDAAVAVRVHSAMKRRERAAVLSEKRSPRQLLALLSRCDLVLGMRLHSVIFGLLGRVPVVALSYDPKVQQVMDFAGLGQLSVDLKAVDASEIAGKLAAGLSTRDQTVAGLPGRLAELARLTWENARIAVELLDGEPPQHAALPQEAHPLLACTLQSHIATGAALRREVQRLTIALEAQRREIRDLQAQAEHQGQRIAEQQQMVQEVQGRVQELEQELRRRETAIEEIRRESDHRARQQAERARYIAGELEIRRKLIAGLRAFDARYRDALATYRRQRAWKVMLCVRKAYTLLMRRGWRGRLDFLKWATGLPAPHAGDLQVYELSFPEVLNYVPGDLQAAFRGEVHEPGQAAFGAPPMRPHGSAHMQRAPQKYDLVFLAIIDFDFRFQRPQQVAAAFARYGHRVFWVSPTRFLPPADQRAYEAILLRDNLWEIHLRACQPDIYLGQLDASHAQSLFRCLQELYRDCAIAESCVVVQLPFWRQLGLALRESFDAKLLYDCMDDWETFQNLGAFNLAEEKKLVRECDILTVTGRELERKYQAAGLQPVLVRNGADFEFFRCARPNDLLAGVPHPIVGYFGAIADWMDLDLIRRVAELRPQYSFVLIGQVFKRDTTRLTQMKNVFLLGGKSYEEIPSYLFHFDACIIPFLLNQVTRATDPVKLYEYLSLGKPVVATDMAELAACSELLYIGTSAEDFAQKLDLAVAERDEDLRRRRIAFAAANTWKHRVETMDGAVRRTFPMVSILIVTHNSAEYVQPCLDSIRRNTAYPQYEVVIVDNASQDGTPAMLQGLAAADPRIMLSCLPENRGFAAGNNLATRQARGEYFILLNPDTVVTPGWIGRLLRHATKARSAGMVVPVTNFAGNEVKIAVDYKNCSEMEAFALSLARNRMGESLEIQVAPFFCALVPRAVWEEVGGLDEQFEIGMFEDDDFSLRVRRAGYRIVAAEDCFVHHFGQGSFAKLRPERYEQIFAENRRRFESKWQREWMPHRTRPGVRPPFEEAQLTPTEFLRTS